MTPPTFRVLGRSGPLGRGLDREGADALALVVGGGCVVVADKPKPGELCAVCEQPRRPERSRRYAASEADRDPFCSAPCARRFYGTTLPEKSTGSRVA